jgi:YD repeat-containing protein
VKILGSIIFLLFSVSSFASEKYYLRANVNNPYPAEPDGCVGITWSTAVNESSPPPQCPALAGNPIDTSTGAKIQKETDIYSKGIGQINFERSYSNANKNSTQLWFNSYQKFLRVIDPQKIQWIREKSSPYTSKALACTNGWNQIKSKISESWAQGTTAQYINETCQIVRNNSIVRNLPILPNGPNVELYTKPGSIQLVREGGSIFNFGLSTNNQYRELNGERGQLTAITDSNPIAWRFKTNSGDIEDYNADGKLLSITASNGMRQELFYAATSELLSSVKDSTGRELVFAYTGNQISSVTVDGTTSYTYNASGLITQVTRLDNTIRIYHYEDTRFPTALTGITDERRARYYTQGRTTSSEHTSIANTFARRATKIEGQPTANI